MCRFRWLAMVAFGLLMPTASAGDQPASADRMPAFENGLYFLAVEDYADAEACFAQVVETFPGSAEAWAHLGTARLLKFSDGLAADDLRRLDVGLFIAGVRFRRPDAAGGDEKMKRWKDAEAALQTALKLK